MDDVAPQSSPEAQNEARIFKLKSSAARGLEVTPQEVILINPDDEGARFLYGFTEPPEGRAGFFKLAQTPENNVQLARESVGLQIAERVGIPITDILHPYQETPEGYGLIHVEQLDAEQGTILTSAELIAAADQEYGARAAVAISAASGKEIPSDIDTSILNRGDGRNKSPETFWKVWEEQNNGVFDAQNDALVEDLIGVDTLKGIVADTKRAIEPALDAAQNPDVEYFVHGDTAPNNIFFSDTVLLLDFEHAAASHNPLLAKLTDYGNYYGRLWPNPEMQKEFLQGLLDQSPSDTLDDTYQLLRTTAVFGAMFLAKYGMDPEHGEHTMSKSLIGNLEQNLASLKTHYDFLNENSTQ